jgi:hypothetical protein
VTDTWCSKNPHALFEVPLHDLEVGVWCAVNACNCTEFTVFEQLNSSSLLTHTALQGSNGRENEHHAGQCHIPYNDCSRSGISLTVDKSWIIVFCISIFQELQL